MKIEERNDYILITQEESFEVFFQIFEKEHPKLEQNHLILEISDNLNIVEKDILLLLRYAELHEKNGTTFVVVFNSVDVDAFPETFNIVPTLREAEDVLEMENIQRDLD